MTLEHNDLERLINILDPDRDYGERTYDEVVSGVRDGSILISPGNKLPMLVNAKTAKIIKGTGQPPQDGISVQQRALFDFRQLALDDLPQAYENLWRGMRRGDPRYDKIYWENLLGKMGEAKGGEAMAEAFKALIAALDKPEKREIVFDQ